MISLRKDSPFKKIAVLFTAIFLSCVSGKPLLGQESVKSVTLEELEQTALLNNPAIQAYEQKINALKGYWTQAGLGPNPEIGYVGEEMSSASPGGRQGFELSQEILGGNQLYHAQQVVCQQMATAQQELEISKTRVLTDVRVAAYEYLAIQNKLFHLREILKNDQQMSASLETSYKNGNASRLDYVNSRIAARKSEQQLCAAQNELDAAWDRLVCLIGQPQLEPQILRADLNQTAEQKSWESYAQNLILSSPEVIRAEGKVAEAQKKVNYENSKNSQNFTVSGAVMYNTEEHVIEGSVGVSMPLRIRDRNQGNISAACSEVIQAQKDLERVKLNIQHRLAGVYREYATACEDLAMYRESLLPEAAEALELARKAYENQETSMLDLITAQKTYRETNIEYYDALCKYWTSLTLLEGKLLDGSLEDSSL